MSDEDPIISFRQSDRDLLHNTASDLRAIKWLATGSLGFLLLGFGWLLMHVN
jgi:hypothetical protein